MSRRYRPTIKSPCVADRALSRPGRFRTDRIAEVSFPDGSGALIALYTRLESTRKHRIDVYRADPDVETVSRETVDAHNLLRRCLPLLTELGNYIGNGPIDPERDGSLGARCDLIGDIKTALGED